MNKLTGKILLLPLLMLTILVATPSSRAQTESAPAQQAAPAPVKTKYLYDRPNRQKFSRLFWALGMLDLNKDSDIDNYLMFNECDIYRDYRFNEFEWKKIRASGRDFLAKNKDTFPLRFEMGQPLLLQDYDLEKKTFSVQDDYKIKETTRLEIYANDYQENLCGQASASYVPQVPGYPYIIVAELNRPLNLTEIPVDSVVAQKYIDDRMVAFKKLDTNSQTKANLYRLRDAYIFFQMKFFSFKKIRSLDGNIAAEIMAVLEGVEIYADKDKKVLLWKQDFRRKPGKKASETPETPAPTAPATAQ